jgi:D-alanine--poly(phosphoribitol) ligase subunit 2
MENQIKEIIFKSIKELNENLDEDQKMQLSINTILLGKDSNIDSITLVNLIVSIEENLEENLNVSVTLADEKALSQKNSPFLTIKTLLDYITLLTKENA